MKQLFLVFGEGGGHGKTYLAKHLSTEHGFERFSLDNAYVDFIKTSCPILYFDALKHYIAPHYDGILMCRAWSLERFGRDFVAEWHSQVIVRVEALVKRCDAVVVEGYLLKGLISQLQGQLEHLTKVVSIEARERHYYQGEQELTFEEIM